MLAAQENPVWDTKSSEEGTIGESFHGIKVASQIV